MSNETVAVRLADRSMYPVMPLDKPGRKRVVLTTSRDDQDSIDVPIFLTDDQGGELAPLGSLFLSDLSPFPKGEAQIQLDLDLDDQGMLRASVVEEHTGNSRSLAVAVDDFSAIPAFDFPGDQEPYTVPESLSDSDLFVESDEAIVENSRRRETGVTALLVLLFLLLLAAGAVLLVWWIRSGSISREATAPATTPEPSAVVAPETSLAPETTPAEATPAPAAAPAQATSPADVDIAYRILWGDTLWDISDRFYGTPWRFPEIADYNRIRNPDLIFAEKDLVIPAK